MRCQTYNKFIRVLYRIRDDMILDNRYLYDILTEGKYPERIPLDKLLTGAK